MITALLILLALLWLWSIALHCWVTALQRQVDRMCGIEDRP